jgi:4-hydroxybenzoyl-CoA reductase subunit beta
MIAKEIYLQPTTIQEAIEMGGQQNDEFKYIAGGTDVMVNRFQGNEKAPCLIDLSEITELKGVEKDNDFLRIGALEKLDGLKKFSEIANEFPMLIEAAHSVGSPLIRKSATIGGNILCENRCLFYNQSDWWRNSIGLCLKCDGDICIATKGKKACFSELVSDTAPALISMDAELELIDNDGERRVKLEDIYTGDGVKPLNLNKMTILKAILLPLNRQFRTVFKKLRQRKSLEFTSLTSAVSVDKTGRLKIALAGVDPKVVVVQGTLNDDKEKMIKKAIKGARAVDNDMYSRKYRREMITVFLHQSFEELAL